MGPKIIPKGMQFWPNQHDALSPRQVEQMYASGFAGAFEEPEETARFNAEMPWPNGEDAAHEFGWAGSAAGKLVMPFIHVATLYPGCMPGPAQERGDCVSHSQKNAALMTMCCEVVAGAPDEVSGKVESAPQVSVEGIKNGVLSTESFYWHRAHGGDGWSCDAAARVGTSKSGLWLRQNYEELGVDLTRYSGRNAGLYGRSRPPESFDKYGLKNLIRTATRVSTADGVRDFLANGYGITTCGSEAWENARDKYGFSRRRGSWAHALGLIAFDDRDIIKQIFGEPLVGPINSWAVWNSGPRDIYESASLVPPELKQRWIELDLVNPDTGNIMLPKGAWWSKWSDFSRRQIIALSGVNGWPAQKLPDLGFNVWG